MSALGQKRTCAVQNDVSALPPKADASDNRYLSEPTCQMHEVHDRDHAACRRPAARAYSRSKEIESFQQVSPSNGAFTRRTRALINELGDFRILIEILYQRNLRKKSDPRALQEITGKRPNGPASQRIGVCLSHVHIQLPGIAIW